MTGAGAVVHWRGGVATVRRAPRGPATRPRGGQPPAQVRARRGAVPRGRRGRLPAPGEQRRRGRPGHHGRRRPVHAGRDRAGPGLRRARPAGHPPHADSDGGRPRRHRDAVAALLRLRRAPPRRPVGGPAAHAAARRPRRPAQPPAAGGVVRQRRPPGGTAAPGPRGGLRRRRGRARTDPPRAARDRRARRRVTGDRQRGPGPVGRPGSGVAGTGGARGARPGGADPPGRAVAGGTVACLVPCRRADTGGVGSATDRGRGCWQRPAPPEPARRPAPGRPSATALTSRPDRPRFDRGKVVVPDPQEFRHEARPQDPHPRCRRRRAHRRARRGLDGLGPVRRGPVDLPQRRRGRGRLRTRRRHPVRHLPGSAARGRRVGDLRRRRERGGPRGGPGPAGRADVGAVPGLEGTGRDRQLRLGVRGPGDGGAGPRGAGRHPARSRTRGRRDHARPQPRGDPATGGG
ncbi:hypothetical protein NOCARDAX2BIS_210058 [Nocardioides sp. AX2bis]|nr:hypothetical protein NOCARDAX2BIS_210058 [Nocardioides sp. AX2bis]